MDAEDSSRRPHLRHLARAGARRTGADALDPGRRDPEPPPDDRHRRQRRPRRRRQDRSTAGARDDRRDRPRRGRLTAAPPPNRLGAMSDPPEAPGRRKVRRRIRKLTRIGSPSDRTVMRAVRWLTAGAIAFANLVGTAIVFVLLVWVLPPGGRRRRVGDRQPDPRRRLRPDRDPGRRGAGRSGGLRPSRQWLKEDRPPTKEEQRNLLRAPLQRLRRSSAASGCSRPSSSAPST